MSALPKENLVEKYGAQVVGKAEWSPKAAELMADLKKREAAAPKANVPSGKGRKTRRHRRRGKKSKSTRRR